VNGYAVEQFNSFNPESVRGCPMASFNVVSAPSLVLLAFVFLGHHAIFDCPNMKHHAEPP
jgi:hypothetical protein